MTGHSVQKVHFFYSTDDVREYKHGIIYDEVKNTAAVSTGKYTYMHDIYSRYYRGMQVVIIILQKANTKVQYLADLLVGIPIKATINFCCWIRLTLLELGF